MNLESQFGEWMHVELCLRTLGASAPSPPRLSQVITNMLSPVEDFWLRWHVEHSNDELAECARLVLQAESSGSPAQAAAGPVPSSEAVAGVLAKFEHDRLAAVPRAKLRLTQLIQLDSADSARQPPI